MSHSAKPPPHTLKTSPVAGGHESATSPTAGEPPAPARSARWRKLLLLSLLIAGLAWGAGAIHHMLTHAETDDAYLTGYVHQVSPHVGGTVSEVLVEQNTKVKAGDPLFRLDPRDNEAKVQQAAAQLAQSEALISFTNAELAGATAKIDQAQAQFVKAQFDFERTQELFRTKVASKQEFDAMKAAVDTARATVVSSKAAAESMEAGLRVAEAQRQNSRVSLENAKLQLSYDVIAAPVSGLTSKRGVEAGAYVQPGQSLIAIVEPDVWIEANFKETQLAKVRKGQRVDITIDALPGSHFNGLVESFSPASGAQFAMLPPDNATGNFTKVVQRLPILIRLEAPSIRGYEDRLRPGLSAVVSIDLR